MLPAQLWRLRAGAHVLLHSLPTPGVRVDSCVDVSAVVNTHRRRPSSWQVWAALPALCRPHAGWRPEQADLEGIRVGE